jgi:hypothetical protein
LNVVEFASNEGRTYERKGLATGGLFECFEKLKKSTNSSTANQLKVSFFSSFN